MAKKIRQNWKKAYLEESKVSREFGSLIKTRDQAITNLIRDKDALSEYSNKLTKQVEDFQVANSTLFAELDEANRAKKIQLDKIIDRDKVIYDLRLQLSQLENVKKENNKEIMSLKLSLADREKVMKIIDLLLKPIGTREP